MLLHLSLSPLLTDLLLVQVRANGFMSERKLFFFSHLAILTNSTQRIKLTLFGSNFILFCGPSPSAELGRFLAFSPLIESKELNAFKERNKIILNWNMWKESYFWTTDQDMKVKIIFAAVNNLSGWLKAWKNSGLTENRTLTFAITGRNAQVLFQQLRFFILLRRLCSHSQNNRELKNHDEVRDDDVCWLGKDWNENVGFGGKKEP